MFWIQISYEKVFRKSAEIHTNLRKFGKLIEDADIILAAFCVVNDYTLVTNNTKHFVNVEGLRITDWVVDNN